MSIDFEVHTGDDSINAQFIVLLMYMYMCDAYFVRVVAKLFLFSVLSHVHSLEGKCNNHDTIFLH